MATRATLRKVGILALRVGVAAILAYAGAVKVMNPAQFALDLGNYQLVPAGGALVLALYVPWVEIVCAIGLWFRRVRGGAWFIATGLSVGFLVFLGSAWARGLDVSCGCFGSGEAEPVGPLSVARAVGLLSASGVGLKLDGRFRPPSGEARETVANG